MLRNTASWRGVNFLISLAFDLSTFLRLFGSMQLRVKGMTLTENGRR
jgi:hypothetical protein